MEGNEAELPPAGWYPNPHDALSERYWDGSQWTEHTRPFIATPPPPAAEPVVVSGPPQSPPMMASPGVATGPTAPAPPGYQPSPIRPGPSGPPPRSGSSGASKVLMVLGVIFLLLLGGCAVLVVGGTLALRSASDDLIAELEELEDLEGQGFDEEGFPATVPPTTLPGFGDQGDGGDEGGIVSADGKGTRADPLPYDTPVVLEWNVFGDADGSKWETSVGAPRDMTAEVLSGDFNQEPPDGVVYAGFPVSITLLEAQKEPLSAGFNFSWEILGGATAAAYEIGTVETDAFGCGLVENDFDIFAEVFVGGTVEGTVCIPIPADDLGHPDTQVAMHFFDDSRAVFGP